MSLDYVFEDLYDFQEVWSVCRVEGSAILDQLSYSRICIVGYLEALAFFNFIPDITHIQAIEGHFTSNQLPKKGSISIGIYFLIIESFLEKLGCHVSGCA